MKKPPKSLRVAAEDSALSAARGETVLRTRRAAPADPPLIRELMLRAGANGEAAAPGLLRGQLTHFPAGQFVVARGDAVVGFGGAFRIAERHALAAHDRLQITGGGYGSRHDASGEWLYGTEVWTDPAHRRFRIDQRINDARKSLARDLGLKGVVIAARLGDIAKKGGRFATADAYLDAVRAGAVRHAPLARLLRAGFELRGVLDAYDGESSGAAALMVWPNPEFDPGRASAPTLESRAQTVRVTSVQMQVRAAPSFEAFLETIEHFVAVAADYSSDFVVFPEHFTLPLLAMEPTRLGPEAAIARQSERTDAFVARLRKLAVEYRVNIIGGTHTAHMSDGDIHNVAYVALRDGTVRAQEKVQPTPDEVAYWGVQGGDAIDAIQTDCGPIGVLICYDSEFPELARRLADQGARLLFVPFCTDTRQGYLRVRYCSQARAIENQCYVVLSGNVGTVSGVGNFDIQYAQSAILTPCDVPFARDGVAALASENVEMVVMADLNLGDLEWARSRGSVRTLTDRRFDLYHTAWRDGG